MILQKSVRLGRGRFISRENPRPPHPIIVGVPPRGEPIRRQSHGDYGMSREFIVPGKWGLWGNSASVAPVKRVKSREEVFKEGVSDRPGRLRVERQGGIISL
jgi:hypothetical protein